MVEQVGHRAHAPRHDGRRAQRIAQIVELRARDAGLAQLAGDALEHAQEAAQAVGLLWERGVQALAIRRPALWHTNLVIGEQQRVEAVRIELVPVHPAFEADAAQDRADLAGVDAADVVQADVELPLALATEDLAAAAGDVVLLEHEDTLVVGGEVCGRAQSAQARPDHHCVPVHLAASTDRRYRYSIPIRWTRCRVSPTA